MGKISAHEYLDELWAAGNRRFDDLSEDESTCLTGLIINEAEKNSKFEFLCEGTNSDENLDTLSSYMISHDLTENGERFIEKKRELAAKLLETLVKNAVDHAEYFINDMFERKNNKINRDKIWCDKHDPEHIYGTDYRR